MTGVSFRVHAYDGAARSGVIHTPRGDIRTPAFMPVGTAATVKAMLPESVRADRRGYSSGQHLPSDVAAHGGTDCPAGRVAQVHELGAADPDRFWRFSGHVAPKTLRKLNEKGVTFQSHIDGHEEFLSPERAMEIQRLLGSDIQMVLDECPALPASREAEIQKSLGLIHAVGGTISRGVRRAGRTRLLWYSSRRHFARSALPICRGSAGHRL